MAPLILPPNENWLTVLADAGDGVVQLVLNTPFQSWDSELGLLRSVARASGRPATFSMGVRLRRPLRGTTSRP